jgi:hypothetical protein
MPAYILACEQVGVPSTVLAADGSVSMTCASGAVSLIEYAPTIFVPLSPGEAVAISIATLSLWASVWLMRLLSNFISGRNHHEPD